jgi:hypothetical protein
MGVAMAAMLVPRLNPVRGGVPVAACVTAFTVAWAWFALKSLRDRRRSSPGQKGRRSDRRAGGDDHHHHHLAHLLSCGSMIFMLLAVATGTAGAAMTMSGPASESLAGHAGPTAANVAATGLAATGSAVAPLIALALAVATAGSIVVTTDRLAASAGRGRPGHGPSNASQLAAPGTAAPALCPRLAACCQIAMRITMVFMLVQML